MERVMRAGAWVLLTTAALVSACSDAGPSAAVPGLTIVSGAGATDTIGTELRAPLVIRVLDSAGTPLANHHMILEPRDCLPYYALCPAYLSAVGDSTWQLYRVDSTDAKGYVRARVRLGFRAGEARIRITDYETLQVVVASYTVMPGRVAAILPAPRDSALYVDGAYTARATTYDRGGNPRAGDPVTFVRVDGPITVGADGSIHGTGIGRARLLARTGTIADTAWVSVVPRGELAVALYADNTDVRTVQLDGSGLATVVASGFWDGGQPAWIGPAPSLVFVLGPGGGGGGATLRVTDGGGASHRLIPSSTATNEQLPRVSRDGAWTYFQSITAPESFAEIWRVRLDGTGAERVGAPADPSHTDADPDPSPDGTRVAYATTRPDGTWHVVVRDLATGTDQPVGVPGRFPRWSPAGDRLVYWNTTDGYNGTIHVVGTDGSGDRRISAEGLPYGAVGLDWSADGLWVVARGEHGLDLIEAATGQTLPLGWSAPYAWPAWRPE
jgi:Tol biopolymer transport system component